MCDQTSTRDDHSNISDIHWRNSMRDFEWMKQKVKAIRIYA